MKPNIVDVVDIDVIGDVGVVVMGGVVVVVIAKTNDIWGFIYR